MMARYLICSDEMAFSVLDSSLHRVASLCRGVDSSAEVQKALQQASGDLSQIVSFS